jgi:hypothetical protein
LKSLEMNSKIKIPIQDFIDYEKDLLEEEEIISFFQKLADTGIAWIMGSHYAAITAAFITEGVIAGTVPTDFDIPDLEDV